MDVERAQARSAALIINYDFIRKFYCSLLQQGITMHGQQGRETRVYLLKDQPNQTCPMKIWPA